MRKGRPKWGIIVLLVLVCSFIHCNDRHGETIRKQLFDLNWRFNPGENVFASEVDFYDQNWGSLDLPHAWSQDKILIWETSNDRPESKSVLTGWYRKHFEIPQSWLDKSILLDFEGISSSNTIFVNGVEVAPVKGDQTSFRVLLNPYLRAGENNVIAVRVEVSEAKDKTWGNASGIYKHVWLIIKDSHAFKK